jgi:hypothetical protein
MITRIINKLNNIMRTLLPQRFHQPNGTASGLPDAVIELVTRSNLDERLGCDSRLHENVICFNYHSQWSLIINYKDSLYYHDNS